jgi:hypothetical protein
MSHSILRILAFLASGLSTFVVTSAQATDSKLYGCWINDRVLQSGLQGAPKNKTIQCAIFYDQKTKTTACPSEEKPNTFEITAHTFEVVASGEYLAKFIRNDSAPHVIGSTLKFYYQADSKSLFLLTFPRSATPVPLSRVMRDESVSLKVAAKSKEDCLFKAVEKSGKSLGV